MSTGMRAIAPRPAVAFNRSTLLIDSGQPDSDRTRPIYYTNAITNHHGRIVHAGTIDGRGYAFPYDDVTPAGMLISPPWSPGRPRPRSP
jgi:hypothetical protein